MPARRRRLWRSSKSPTTGTAPVLIAVLENDTFNGQPIVPAEATVTLLTNAANGNALLNSDKTFTYTASAGFSGADSFTYRVSVNESNAYVTATLAGLGISQITSHQAHPHLESGALVRLLPEWTQPLLPIYVVYPPNRHLSAKVRAFVDWAAELVEREVRPQRAS